MTRDEILKLEGRELDAAVAVHVLGWRWQSATSAKFSPNPFRYLVSQRGEKPVYAFDVTLLEYSEAHELLNYAAGMAWDSFLPPLSSTWEGMRLVDEAMHIKGWMLDLSRGVSGLFQAEYDRFLNGVLWSNDSDVIGSTAPLALARAALLAVMESHDAH